MGVVHQPTRFGDRPLRVGALLEPERVAGLDRAAIDVADYAYLVKRIALHLIARWLPAIDGRLRMTEQGETINAKYGLDGIAMRSLEQTVGALEGVPAVLQRVIEQETGKEVELFEATSYAAMIEALIRESQAGRMERAPLPEGAAAGCSFIAMYTCWRMC